MLTVLILLLLSHQVDPLVSLMMVEKVPDSTYEMVGGLDKQIKEIKEVCLCSTLQGKEVGGGGGGGFELFSISFKILKRLHDNP